MKSMKLEVSASIFLKDDFTPLRLKKVLNFKNNEQQLVENGVNFDLLFVLTTNYKINQDLEQINRNSLYMCGIEKWDKLSIWYSKSDYEQLLELNQKSIHNQSQLAPSMKEVSRLKRLEEIKEKEIMQISQAIQSDLKMRMCMTQDTDEMTATTTDETYEKSEESDPSPMENLLFST